MKVSTTSWHYRYLTESNIKFDSVPHNLCPYVRHILLQAATQAWVFGLIIGIGLGPVWIWVFGMEWSLIPWYIVVFQILFLTLLLISIGAGLVFLWFKYIWDGGLNLKITLLERQITKAEAKNLAYYERYRAGETTASERIRAWLTAIHGKICPIVEWEE